MDFYASNQIPKDLAKSSFSAGIALRMPGGMAPLFAMSGLARKRYCTDIEHGYWSKQYDYPVVTVKGSDLSASTTSIPLGTDTDFQYPNAPKKGLVDRDGVETDKRGVKKDCDRIIPGMILRFMKDGVAGSVWAPPELLYVTAVDTAANSCTVMRGFAGTTAAAIPANSKLIVVGNAQEEGSKRPQSSAIVPIRHLNYTQIFRNSWDVNGTMQAIALNQGITSVSNNKGDCAHNHARDIETAAWFGRASMGTRNGQPLHTMDGIEALVERYALNNMNWAAGSAGTTFEDLIRYVNPTLDWKTDHSGSNRRVIYAGSEAFQAIQDIGRYSGQYQLVDGQTNFGLQFKRFVTGRGSFDLIENPLFNTNSQWSKMAAVLDLSQFDFVYLQNRDTRHDQYNQLGGLTDGVDATGGVLTSELTIEMQAPFTCAMIYNLSSGKKSA